MNLRQSYLVSCFVVVAVLFCASQKARGEDLKNKVIIGINAERIPLNINTKFSPSARVKKHFPNDPNDKALYQGGTHKGVHYYFGYSRYLKNARFGPTAYQPGGSSWDTYWRVVCNLDLFRIRYCSAGKPGISILVSEHGMVQIFIFDSSRVRIRIDNSTWHEPEDKAGWFGADARRLLPKILKGKEITYPRHEKLKTQKVFGLSVAYEFMVWILNGQKPRGQETNLATNYPKPSTSTPQRLDLIRVIQFTLNLKGYNVGQPDGLMGPKTRAAIKTYQTRNELPSDGKPSIELLNHMVE